MNENKNAFTTILILLGAVGSFFIVMAQESYWCLVAILLAYGSGLLTGLVRVQKKINKLQSDHSVMVGAMKSEYDGYSKSLNTLYEQKLADTTAYYEGEMKSLMAEIDAYKADQNLEKGSGFPEEPIPAIVDAVENVVATAKVKKNKAKAKA